MYLYPGEVIATAEPHTVTTVLGSCVAVCLFDPVTRVGGANHFLLPHRIAGDTSSCRFGSIAMKTLVERLGALGGERRNLRAKMFGGAYQFEGTPDRVPIGQQNIQLAVWALEEEGIPILAREVGGTRGRKMIFQTDSGEVWVKAL